jgi:signal transduction histidine kinase
VRYTGLSLVAPEKVKFKYRLEGLESRWVEAGTKRAADFSYIPPGHYAFHVIACNNDGVWNDTGATLAFTVLPFFWQTWWFRILTGLGLVAFTGGGVLIVARRRMRQKLKQLEERSALEKERTRIARDIHDDLGASLTRITMLSQSARAGLEQTPTASYLDRIYDTALQSTRAMDEVVWAVNPKHDTLDSLAAYLGAYAEDFLALARIRCRLDIPLRLPPWPLTSETRHDLFLAFKEALNNVVKHSAASEVLISLAIDPAGFSIRIEDKGRGFQAGAAESNQSLPETPLSPGNGLRNMRRRLSEIGGRCEIQSAPGAGARVVFIVPKKGSAPPAPHQN